MEPVQVTDVVAALPSVEALVKYERLPMTASEEVERVPVPLPPAPVAEIVMPEPTTYAGPPEMEMPEPAEMVPVATVETPFAAEP